MPNLAMKVTQYYTFSIYGPPRPQKDVKSQDRKIVAGTGVKPAPNVFLPGNSKEKFGKETPPGVLIMDNLEILLAATLYKARGNTGGAILERFVKPRSSRIFFRMAYSLDGAGPLIELSGPHEEFFNSDFGI